MNRPAPLLALALCLSLAACATPPADRATADRQVITSANQLPRTTLALPVLPSELFELPLPQLNPLLAAIETEIAGELQRLDIRDRATLDAYSSARVTLAMLQGRHDSVAPLVRQWRARQEKPAAAATTAMLSDAAAAARLAGTDTAAQRARFRQHLAAQLQGLPWETVSNTVMAQKGSLEAFNPVVPPAGVRAQLDPAARNAGMRLARGSIVGVLQQRNYIANVLPFRDDAVAVLDEYIRKNRRPIADTWTPRTFALRADAPARPVVVAVWDSGVDGALFRMAEPVAGIGFDLESRLEPGLLQPLGAWKDTEWPKLQGFLRGARDNQSNVDSAEASAYRRHVAGLKAEEVQPFQQAMRLAGNYSHGTHVAGIAVEGNPFARVFAARITFSWEAAPPRTTPELRARSAEATRSTVAALRAAGARVVNMSFGGTQRGWEWGLQYHGIGRDAEERRALAREYFMAARDAMRDAMASAPEILFVTTSGNADSDSGFEETSPADIQLPNLLTVGAVDSAGQETSFSSFGRTTVLHANGYLVDSFVPGGGRLRSSGTSMAAPQVANLAAKLWALYPDLTVAQMRGLLLEGAERNGRVNLLHPRRSLELAAALRPAGPRPADVVQR